MVYQRSHQPSLDVKKRILFTSHRCSTVVHDRVYKQPLQVAAFTIIELIVTLIIIGILAAVAAPMFMSPSTFSSTTARDDLLAGMRIAQQRAMADNTVSVQLIVNANAFSITVNGTPISKPDLTGPYPQNFEPDVTVSPTDTLSYDSLGNTTPNTYAFSGGEKICLMSTGFAYAC